LSDTAMSEADLSSALNSQHIESAIDSGAASEWTKYLTYALAVDPAQDNRATEIKICNFKRPHMRAFHCAWWSFFSAFLIWFSIAPIMVQIRTSLDLTKQEVWTSNILGVAGTMFMRFLLGEGMSARKMCIKDLHVPFLQLNDGPFSLIRRAALRQVWSTHPFYAHFMFRINPHGFDWYRPISIWPLRFAFIHWRCRRFIGCEPVLD